MSAQIIDGKKIAETIKQELKIQIERFVRAGYTPPGLAVIQVGEDAASTIYVNHKKRACLDVGIKSFSYNLHEKTSAEELINLLDSLNHQIDIHGILVQLPLPEHLREKQILDFINPNKDVDGFHPYNTGRLTQGRPLLRPCTPYGIMKLFDHIHYDLKGKHAVMVGASNVVGKPMALELLMAGATITICHRHTKDLISHVQQADCLIVACGKPNLVHGTWIKKGAVVIDVGINRLSNGTIIGDIDFESAKVQANWITPVPGGVGPMTVAMLMTNTFEAARISSNITVDLSN
ncbi:MAG TPA: bifunctional methylenetetrahydrofolate dehydrogenase/methenyltetrahydrofolate cyclohydrolase FolD [Gammaproteobacteria bacterium]|nr:bifunctional methylenetetrahydrofolate dehydrogenase/methenyltetrahydrofolate cyclohydrolase FolD [Gammaproteobacteria bacterium]